MHIALDARTITPHFPGIGRYVSALLQALPAVLEPEERVTVLANPGGEVPPRADVKYVEGGPFSLRQQWDVPRALHVLDVDLYHSPYLAMPYRLPVPAVLTVHDLIPLVQPDAVPRTRRLLFAPMLRMALRQARRVICVSASTRDDLCERFGVGEERVRVVPLAAAASFRPVTAEVRDDARRRHRVPERYVLYVGSNKPHKNLVRLVDAWRIVAAHKALREWRLVVAGPWDARYPDPRRNVAAAGLEDRVRFIGRVGDEELAALYAGAGVFVFPSLYEGFGLPVLEAMACGAPVVCGRTASLPEVGGEAAHYVDPYDVESLAAALIALLEDPARRASMRTASLRQARRFDWRRTARQTLKVYRAALA